MNLFDQAWPFVPLGALAPDDRGRYYDDLGAYLKASDSEIAAFFGGGNSDGWESQHFRIGILSETQGQFVNADGYEGIPLENVRVHVYMCRFLAGAMPGQRFMLQLFLAAQHEFDHAQAELVGHSYAANGVLGDYVNLLNEPVFRNLYVGDILKLRLGVNFLVNKDTEALATLLKSEVLTRGIELTRTYNPVFGAALAYIRGVTTAILGARGNHAIISHDVTFTANPSPTVPTLCAGTYIFVQVPKAKLSSFEWPHLRWDPTTSRVLDRMQPLEWNHLLLRFEGA